MLWTCSASRRRHSGAGTACTWTAEKRCAILFSDVHHTRRSFTGSLPHEISLWAFCICQSVSRTHRVEGQWSRFSWQIALLIDIGFKAWTTCLITHNHSSFEIGTKYKIKPVVHPNVSFQFLCCEVKWLRSRGLFLACDSLEASIRTA